jgi:CheY-like chemotaxis protein
MSNGFPEKGLIRQFFKLGFDSRKFIFDMKFYGYMFCFLIDDDEDDREIFGLALQSAYPPVYAFDSAPSALVALGRFQADENFLPDYIFIDINMPGMLGTDCLAEIRKIERLARIPAIIYSTSSNPIYKKDAERLHATHYLIKPTSIAMLSSILSDIFQKKDMPFLLSDD